MPLYQHTNPLWQPVDTSRPQPPYAEEIDRWAALLEEPLHMTIDPGRFGELTMEGYLNARCYQLKQEVWPCDPESVATLLLHCGITAPDIDAVCAMHVGLLGNNALYTANILALHHALRRRMNLPLDRDALFAVLEFYDFDSASTDEYKKACTVMQAYLPTADDQSQFLTQWLPLISAATENYNSRSLGLTLVHAFPLADAEPLAAWCRENDDQQGLGFLVHQGRLPFSDWLLAVTDTTPPAVRSYRQEDDQQVLRRQEQMETLGHLLLSQPRASLQAQFTTFCLAYPERAQHLQQLPMAEMDPASFEALQWMTYLTQLGALEIAPALGQAWLTAALAAQAVKIDAIGDLRVRTQSSFHEEVFAEWVRVLPALGEQAALLLAQEFAMTVWASRVTPTLRMLPHLDWLRDQPIVPILEARLRAATERHDSYAKTAELTLMVALSGMLAPAERARVVTRVAMAILHAEVQTSDMLLVLEEQHPERAALTQGWTLTVRDHALFMLIGETPAPLFALAATMEVDATDPLVEVMLADWVSKCVGVAAPPEPVLPVFEDNLLPS